MVASIVHTPLRAVLDEIFQQGQGFKDDSPRRGTLSFHGLPHETSDDVKAFGIKGITGNLVHQGTGGTPVFVRQDFVDTGFDIGLWFGLVVAVVAVVMRLVKRK